MVPKRVFWIFLPAKGGSLIHLEEEGFCWMHLATSLLDANKCTSEFVEVKLAGKAQV